MTKITSSDLKDYTVRLQVADESGTGFFVAPQLLLTCFHVVRAARENDTVIRVRWKNGEYTAKIEKLPDNETIDLALLRLQEDCNHSHVFLNNQIQEDEKLCTFGYTEDYSIGDPSNFIYIGLIGDKSLIKFGSGQVQPGFSGSPLLNRRTGHICGVVKKSRDVDSDLGGRAIPVSVIFQYFPELKPQKIADNPFHPLSGAIKEIDQIFGREKDLREIFEYLNSGSSVAIIGDSAIGKSSILKAIAHYTPEKLNFTRTPIYMSLGNLQKDDDFYSELCKLIEIKGKVLKGYSFSRELESKGHKILLLLDVVESLAEKGFSIQLRRQLRDLANYHNSPLKLVVAARRSLDSLFTDSGQDSPFENICQEIYLKLWDERVSRDFINHRLANNLTQFTEEELQSIIKESKGHPQKIMKSCYEKYKSKTNDLGHQLPGNKFPV